MIWGWHLLIAVLQRLFSLNVMDNGLWSWPLPLTDYGYVAWLVHCLSSPELAHMIRDSLMVFTDERPSQTLFVCIPTKGRHDRCPLIQINE